MLVIFQASGVKIQALSDESVPNQSFSARFLNFFFNKEVESIGFFIHYLLLKVSNALL